MVEPTLKPNNEDIARFRAELLRQKTKAETEEKTKRAQESFAHQQQQQKLKPKPQPSQENNEKKQQVNRKKKLEPKIHARRALELQELALASKMQIPLPQSSVNTYQSDNHQVTEKKTFSPQ